MIDGRIWPHWYGEREIKQELDRLEWERESLEAEYERDRDPDFYDKERDAS